MTSPDPTTDSAEPTQLGNYDVLSKIAEGGMGTVYRGRHRFTHEVVAIKVIAPGPSRNPVLLQRFEREFQAAKVLDHPNVVRAIEYCGTGPHPFLVMEYVHGESIGQRIERLGAIPEPEALRLIAQVCDGLQRAHKQGLVHRDVKPDNILVTQEGVAKLTDMGLVKEIDNDMNLTKTGRGLGTPHYMAPEQFRNAKGVDVRGDVYSLGATLYAMITGQVPFGTNNPLDCWMKKIKNQFAAPRELMPELSERVDWAIRRAMSAEPAQRPSSCREFLEDLTGQTRNAPTSGIHNAASAEVWYLCFRDEAGQPRTVKGSTDAIRKAIRAGEVGDPAAVVISRSKSGKFHPLPSLPEFRDLIVNPAPLPSPRSSRANAAGLSPTSEVIPPPVPRSGSARRPADEAAVDLAITPCVASPSGRNTPRSSLSNGTAAPISGRYTPSPQTRGSRYSPTPPAVALPDPDAETLSNALAGRHATKTPAPTRRPTIPPHGHQPDAKQPFDRTPVLAALVMILSAALGYVLLTR